MEYIYLGVTEYDGFHQKEDGYVSSLSEAGRNKLFQDVRRENNVGPVFRNHDPVNSLYTDGSVIRQNEQDLELHNRPSGAKWWW
jgi:hypothetical protein